MKTEKETENGMRKYLRENKIDQGKALGQAIKKNDPQLKNAFTPEVAEKFS